MRRLPRRWIGAVIFAGGLLAASVGVVVWRTAAQPVGSARGPLVLISIDTLRADHLPAYGYSGDSRTPAIDALVADGILFERAYTHAPQTLPAHVSLFSGRLPLHHGVRDNVGFSVRSGERLLPEWLREQGITTAGVVSSAVLRESTGIARGFDFFDAAMPPVSGDAALDEAQRDGSASLAIAEQWLRNQPSSRWFLFLHLYEPHAPYLPPERFRHLQPYDGEIAYADELVGRLIDALRDTGRYDPATIVLLSDHGEGLGDHGEQEHGLFVYEEAVHVPLIVKLPGQRNRRARVRELVAHMDIVPTLLDLAGTPVPADLPGRTLRPLLEGRTKGWAERSIYSEALFGRYHFGWSELFALTDSRYRFIQAPRPELYDLQSDSRERHNVTDVRPSTALGMGQALAKVLAGSTVERPRKLAPDEHERLASLGYVGPQTGGADGPLSVRPDPKDKVDVLVRYRRSLEHVAEGRFAEAVDLLRQIAREEPGMIEVWTRAGRLLLRLGHNQEAVAAFKESVRRDPTSVSALLELSTALLRLQRLDEADVHAQLAAAIARDHEAGASAAAYEMLATIALARHDGENARRFAGFAQRADAGCPLPDYVDGRLAYAAGRYEDAWTSFERALRQSRSRTTQIRGLHLYSGDVLARLGRFDEAEREFRDEARFYPDSAWAYLSLANLYQTFGRVGEAEQMLSAMLRAVPSPEARAQAARLRAARANVVERP